ncbi:hypothetical protein C8R43DRAFT_874792, partial [Mycena crocata]
WGPPADTAPLLLSKICRDWRIIALSTPLLWTAGINVFLEGLPIDQLGALKHSH